MVVVVNPTTSKKETKPHMLSIILTDIKEPLTYIPIAFLVAFAGTVLLALSELIRVGRLQSKRRYIPLFFFIAYAYTVLIFAFFSRQPGSRSSVSLIPGETWGTTLQSHAYVIENVLMTIPLGIFISILWPGRSEGRTFGKCLSISLACSVTLEAAQFLTKRGHCQTDDVLTNVAGALIGYGIIYTVSRITVAAGRPPAGRREW